MAVIETKNKAVQGEVSRSLALCDLCKAEVTTATSHHITRAEFQRIVEHGFNPFTENIVVSPGVTLVDLGAAYGLSPENQYQLWKEKALAIAADWLLCDRCYHLARRYSR